MQDRIPRYAGRIKLTAVDEATGIYDAERADDPIQEGTKLNKALLDYAVAANGLTEGTGSAYVLNDGAEGFTLTDGAKINICLHEASQDSPTIDVNSKGSKPLLLAPNVPLKTATEAGTWITAIYSKVFDAFMVLGSASAMSEIVLLPLDGWDSNNIQTVSVKGATVNSVTVSKVVSDYNDSYMWRGVKCIEQGDGYLVFSAVEIPETDVKALIFTMPSNNNIIIDTTPSAPKIVTGSYVGDGLGTRYMQCDNIQEGQNSNHIKVELLDAETTPRQIEFPFEIKGIIVAKDGANNGLITAKNGAQSIELSETNWYVYGYNNYNASSGEEDEVLYIDFQETPKYPFLEISEKTINLYSNIVVQINSSDALQALYNAGWSALQAQNGKMELNTPYGSGFVRINSSYQPYSEILSAEETTVSNAFNEAGVTYHYIAWG